MLRSLPDAVRRRGCPPFRRVGPEKDIRVGIHRVRPDPEVVVHGGSRRAGRGYRGANPGSRCPEVVPDRGASPGSRYPGVVPDRGANPGSRCPGEVPDRGVNPGSRRPGADTAAGPDSRLNPGTPGVAVCSDRRAETEAYSRRPRPSCPGSRPGCPGFLGLLGLPDSPGSRPGKSLSRPDNSNLDSLNPDSWSLGRWNGPERAVPGERRLCRGWRGSRLQFPQRRKAFQVQPENYF